MYPTKEQVILFSKTFGCVRFIYNKMLDDKISHYKATKENLKNTPAQYKSEFDWLKEVDSLALANAQMNLQTAYNNFFRSPKVGFPKFKSKHKNQNSYTPNNQKGSVRIEVSKIKLPKIGFVKIDKWFPSSKMCSACGVVKEKLLLSQRVYSCDCSFVEDRDINAAINIKKQGVIMLA